MTAPPLTPNHDPWVVALSFLIATFSSYVALDLAKRVRTTDRAVARGWWAGGSIAMGSGIWSMHFVGMLALRLPVPVGYQSALTLASWLAGVAVSAIALHLASRERLTAEHFFLGSATMGAGICAMHYIGMAALDIAPGIAWRWGLVAASAAIAVAASAAALLIFFWLRGLGAERANGRQALAAVVMACAISGMHYTGMAAAVFPANFVCLSAGGLRGDSLGMLVAVGSILLLMMTSFTAALDGRMQSRAEKLAESLRCANEELQRLAFRDPLTGLPNRLMFDERASAATIRCDAVGGSLAVMFVDLDGFKPINDSFGHAYGDGVLRVAAQRLKAQIRPIDLVARVGGDEFVLLIDPCDSAELAERVAQRIIEVVSQPIVQAGRELRLSCSIGIAMYRAGSAHAPLIANADAAMYAAKRLGGSTWAFYEPHMDAGASEQVELQRGLRLAIERGELELHYQPKLSATSGRIAGVEALVRWRHPTRGLLGPGVFIPVAERFALIGALGHWVIEESCRQIRAWLDEGLRFHVAINLSVHQLRQDDLVERVRQALATHRVDAALLTFEITETVAMADGDSNLRAFNRLAETGVRLAIDDFGTGYSSLAYLRRLPAYQLKIDRSFVKDLEADADARAIVEAVVRLAHALGLQVVAEGVETRSQQEVLTAIGCDELQGFLFSKPVPAALLALWAMGIERPADLEFNDSAFATPADFEL